MQTGFAPEPGDFTDVFVQLLGITGSHNSGIPRGLAKTKSKEKIYPNISALYLEEQKLLAVSVSMTQQVLLLDPETLRVVKTISTGSNPEGLLVLNDLLYVAESDDASVSANDLSGRTGQARLMVGFGPRRLVDADNQVYVSNYNNGSLSVLLPGQLGVFQEIYGLGQPLEMVFNHFYRQLYVADEREGEIVVIDTNSNRFLGRIPLGAKPLGMVAIK